MTKAISGISNDTKRQLLWTESHNISIGLGIDHRTGDKVELKLKYTDNEEYWEGLEQVHIRQTEFASLGIGYMFYKDPVLNKNNPYIYKDAWVDYGGEISKKPTAAFQQLHHDKIACKIIGTGEQIDAIKGMKYVSDVGDIVYIFDKLEKYNVQLNVPKQYRKKVFSTKGDSFIEVTNIEEYDLYGIDKEEMNYRDYQYLVEQDKLWHKNERRISMLEKRIEKYESRIDLDFQKFAKVLINAYPELKMYEALPEDMWTLGGQDLYKDMKWISKKHNGASYKSLWQTWYNYQIEIMKKEIKWLEENHL